MTTERAPLPPVVRGDPFPVSDGVYVIRDNHVPIVPNVGIVVGTRSTLVIDTGLGQDNGALMRPAAEPATARPWRRCSELYPIVKSVLDELDRWFRAFAPSRVLALENRKRARGKD